jgi:plastocyanin
MAVRGGATLIRMKAAGACLLVLGMPLPVAGASLAVEVRDGHGPAPSGAVVYAVPQGRTPPPATREAVMDQRDRRFVPHVLAVQTGTAVRFPNSDNVRHQVYSFSAAKKFQLPLYAGTPATRIVFDKPGVVALGCNIHDRMSAYIVVVDTPYFAVAEKGHALLTDLPAGSYEVHLWLPGSGDEPAPQPVSLAAAEERRLTLSAARR